MPNSTVGGLPAVVNTAQGDFVLVEQGGIAKKATVAQIAQTVGAAALIPTVPAGGLSSTNVQDALNELDTEKIALTSKDASGGISGLTSFKLNLKNAANTFTNFFTNATTAARTWTMQDRNGVIADDTDLALKAALAGGAGAVFTGTITPAQVAGIVGTTTNNNAQVGSVGEFVTANNSAVPLAFNTGKTITSVSLTAGDWDVSGVVSYSPAGTTNMTIWYVGISTVADTLGTFSTTNEIGLSASGVVGTGQVISTPSVRISIASTTTVYLIAQVAFTVSTMTASGVINARRVR